MRRELEQRWDPEEASPLGASGSFMCIDCYGTLAKLFTTVRLFQPAFNIDLSWTVVINTTHIGDTQLQCLDVVSCISR